MGKKSKYSLVGAGSGLLFSLIFFLIFFNLPSDFSVQYGYLFKNFLEYINPIYMTLTLGGRLDLGLGGAILLLVTSPFFLAIYGAIIGFFIGKYHGIESSNNGI